MMNGNKQLNEKQKKLEILRKRAEALVDSQNTSDTDKDAAFEQKKLVHELLTYQTELELQFEELLTSQDDLFKEKENFSRLFNDAPVGYLIIDSKCVIKKSNREFSDMVDIDMLKVCGKPLVVFISSTCHAQLFDSLHTVSKNLTYEKFELELKLRDNTNKWVQCELKPYMADDDNVYFLLALMDITNIKSMEDELLQKNMKLSDMNMFLEKRVSDETEKRLKNEYMLFENKRFSDMGMMINAIAHQWRQPLNVLNLIIQDMLMDMPEDIKSKNGHDENEHIALKTVSYMSDTIDDFLSFFRDNSTDGCFNIIESLMSTLSLLDARLKKNHVELQMNCKCGESTFDFLDKQSKPKCIDTLNVKGSSSKLKQVIMNLIQNPLDLFEGTRNQGIIKVSVELEKHHISIAVEDNAGGIKVDPISKIFDPYFTTKHKSQGTGIGLYMSKVIIEDYFKGILTAMNTSVGAKFIIRLPINIKGS
ncbi:MAG: hypothetical protein C0603_06485 [Denitrovibrio sp.]|nr:MAG: hypothetical protein C0603_06485 [Denitrovibrio sp.]